jgi:hypothetical protein
VRNCLDPVGEDLFPKLSFVGEVYDHREEKVMTKRYVSLCVLGSVTNILHQNTNAS